MDANERKLLVTDLVSVIDARLVKPLERRIEARFSELAKTDEELRAKDAKLSGEHRAVTKVMIPQMQSAADDMRRGDMAGVADAFNKMVHVVADIGDAVARVEAAQQPRATVELPDGKGGKSIQPASLVAAQSSVRTEVKQEVIANKQDSIGKMVLDAALETTKVKDDAASTKRRATITLLVGLAVGAIDLGAKLWPLIFPHQ